MLNRLYNILDTFYHYDIIDYDMDLETIEKNLLKDPVSVINVLLDIIEDIQE